MGRSVAVLVGVSAVMGLRLASLPAQSQPVHPDLSGRWTLMAGSGVAPVAPLWGEGVITQDSSNVTVTPVVTAGRGDSGRVSYRLDGVGTDSTMTTVLGETWTLTSQAKWVDRALVVATTYRTPIGQWQDFTTLSFDAAGHLTVTTDKTPKPENVPRIVKQYTYRRN
jgi:hypothetical protein